MSYKYKGRIDKCDHCGRVEEDIILAKSSVGWKPLIKLHKEFNDESEKVPKYYKNWEEFKKFVRSDKVEIYRTDQRDNRTVDPDEMIEFIERTSQNDELKTHNPEHHLELLKNNEKGLSGRTRSMQRRSYEKSIEEDQFKKCGEIEMKAGGWF